MDKISDAELLAMACEFDLGVEPLLAGRIVEDMDVPFSDLKMHHVYVKNSGNPDDGPDRWCIHRHSLCLNKDGEWQYQWRNSEKTDEFYQHCRFESVHEAILYYLWWKKAILKWARKRVAEAKGERVVLNYEDCPLELRKF